MMFKYFNEICLYQIDFLPNYEDMMSKSMKTGGGGSADSSGSSAGSSFRNFSNVNEMLKGFMELQKEQLKVEQAKAEATKAKVNLALDYDDEDDLIRKKRSLPYASSDMLTNNKNKLLNDTLLKHLLDLLKTDKMGKIEPEISSTLSSRADAGNQSLPLMVMLPYDLLQSYLSKLYKSGDPSKYKTDDFPYNTEKALKKHKPYILRPKMSFSFKEDEEDKRSWQKKPSYYLITPPKRVKERISSPKSLSLRQSWPGATGKYFRRRQSQSSPSSDSNNSQSSNSNIPPSSSSSSSSSNSSPPPFWESIGSKAKDWFKNSAGSSGSGSTPLNQGSSSSSPWASPSSSSSSPSWSNSGAANGGQPISFTPSTGTSSGCTPTSDTNTKMGQYPAAPSTANNQMRRSIETRQAPLPPHGSIGITNIPNYQSSQPFASPTPYPQESNIIPSVSFSLNPTKPVPEKDYESLNSKATLHRFKPERKSKYLLTSSLYPKPTRIKYPPPVYEQNTISPPTYVLYANSQPLVSYLQEKEVVPSSSPLVMLRPSYSPNVLQAYRKDIHPILIQEPQPFKRSADDSSPLMIYKVKKDEFGYPKHVDKYLLDPENGIIIDKSEKGDMTKPVFPTKRRNRRSPENNATSSTNDTKKEDILGLMDENGHSHSKKLNDQEMSAPSFVKDMIRIPGYKTKRYTPKKKTYQYQSGGGSTDSDYDYVQEDEGGNDIQTRSYEKTGENEQIGQPQEERRRKKELRRVKVSFKQMVPGGLPPGTIEKVSAGGGQSPGHHEGGGLTVKVKEGFERKLKERDVEKRKTLNFFFTW